MLLGRSTQRDVHRMMGENGIHK
jgi:hypothetical protein